MSEKKFDPKKLKKLNDPNRLLDISPEFIWSKLNIIKPEVLVDIGAGTGFFALHFLDFMDKGKIFACDISDIMIQWMRENICKENPGIIPMKTEENKLPLEDGIADLVYMINLHHELEKPEKILQESFRVLKQYGKIFIVDWKKENMDQGPPLRLRYLPEQVKAQLIDAGFDHVLICNDMPKHFLLVAEKSAL